MRYHDITKDDMKNGDGLRVVLWVAGCSHHCPGCQNPVTWDPEDGLPFDRAAEEEIFGQLEQEYISGLTLSGGDPLYEGNREAVTELVRKVKSRYPKKTIWLYTGYRWEEIRDLEVIRDIDVVVDGRYIQEERDITLEWRGSANQRVIDVPKTRELGQIVLLV
ncbi:MAG TPA: anaerobic ribonucleoside-triphosphate reductase activating protein [Candidatus Scatomonas pullistercoris]|uniref:Anaerobic ribonucleoside-triphosphate reductase-activating protein n=1 Tax=Candidatus Scatomonas pullistercoris TaxID=2840920 RepID=A0A9D1P0U8_9FIRM|nr:anaerobic ribonucleoside-triphosphate reductase activating protein [Candidatus Scatomonas pullistercoris]